MAFVVSAGQLQVTGPLGMPTLGALPLSGSPWEYAEIWRTQPQVRTVVGFLARNLAHIGLHTYRRVSDTDRERLTDHPLALLLKSPMPRYTCYRLIERLVADQAVYDEAFWLKVRVAGRLNLLPVPPDLIRPMGGSWAGPEYYEAASGRRFEVDEVVHFHGYTPGDMRVGTSPIESLRSLLLEERESSSQRAAMWRSGARMTGVLSRPADAEDWSPEARRRFQEMWRTFAQGGGAEGGTPILEDGMVYTPIAISPQAAQYIEARKLTREEVAAAYYIPPPLIGILDHATYSNIKEQHSHLYQDTLGPWMESIQQDIEAQLLPDLPDNDRVYVEFNIAQKMAGSFEEQAAAASTATGGPWMTRNEQRARANLPRIEGGDELITPMNVTTGGLASPRDTAPAPAAAPKAAGRPVSSKAGRPSEIGEFAAERDAMVKTLMAWTVREGERLLTAAGAKADGMPDLLALWDAGADDRLAQLQALLGSHAFRVAQAGAWEVLEEFNPAADGWDADVMLAWLTAAAETHAEQHEAAGREAVEAVAEDPGGSWQDGLALAATAWGVLAEKRGRTAATEARGFGGHDAAGASGLMRKVWRTGGVNPRPSHKALNGESVALDDVFGNGCRWPGDTAAKDAETANCNCRLDYTRE